MLSLFPTLLFFVQSIFLYFEREFLVINKNSFWLIATIIFLNISTIFFVDNLPKKKYKSFDSSKINQKLSNKQNSKIIFLIYLFMFFIQLIIRGSLPIFTGLTASEVIYTTWPVSPFSGFMSVLFILILGERISVWGQLRKETPKNINNIILVLMTLLSLLMLRRDLFALLIFGYSIRLYVFIIKFLKGLFFKLKINKFTIIETRNILLIFLISIFIFSIIGGLRGQGTGVNRKYWQIITLYITTPLSNSLNIINFEESGYLGLGYFFIGGSEFGKKILDFIGIDTGGIPRENLLLPQFNLVSSLGIFYQVFGKYLYILVIGIYSGILRLMEIQWVNREPILYSIILLLASGSIFNHYFGSITITLVFPIIYLINRLIIRLK